jgi:Nickel responsive protein SCO4226-like
MRLARYTVELSHPAAGWAELQEIVARARQAAADVRREGEPIRFLRSVFVPEDDACFFLYEGPSAQAVKAAAQRAQLGVRRVDAALRLELEGEETS